MNIMVIRYLRKAFVVVVAVIQSAILIEWNATRQSISFTNNTTSGSS